MGKQHTAPAGKLEGGRDVPIPIATTRNEKGPSRPGRATRLRLGDLRSARADALSSDEMMGHDETLSCSWKWAWGRARLARPRRQGQDEDRRCLPRARKTWAFP